MSKTSYFLYLASIILILHGLVGVIGITYAYLRIERVYDLVYSISNQFISLSQTIEGIKTARLISGSYKMEIEKINKNLLSLKSDIVDTASRFRSMGDAFNICIFEFCPFGSVRDLFYSLSRTTYSASDTIGQASDSLSRIQNLKIEDILTQDQLLMLNSYKNQLFSYGELLRGYAWALPYIFSYILFFYVTFILIGISIILLTGKINHLLERLEKIRK